MIIMAIVILVALTLTKFFVALDDVVECMMDVDPEFESIEFPDDFPSDKDFDNAFAPSNHIVRPFQIVSALQESVMRG